MSIQERSRKILIPFEDITYYISSITLLNLIYALRIFGYNWRDNQQATISNKMAFIMATSLATMGIIYTVFICYKDHSIKNKNTLGKTLKIISCKDITGDNYFSKYSLLVMTGNSLPMFNSFIGLLIYLIVLLSVGLIFIRQKMYYMNPIVILLGYQVVHAKCHALGSDDDYYFIYRHGTIESGKTITFQNINSRIIRLKEV